MAKNIVVINGINTSNLKVLKHNEMKDLFNKLKNGDKSAKNILINDLV